MRKKLVLKPFVLPTLYIVFLVSMMFMATSTLYKKQEPKAIEEKEQEEKHEDSVPVVYESDEYVLRPYEGQDVVESIGYYNYDGDEASQEKSIIQYDNTYLQNTGISYYSDNNFEVIAVMDGTVSKIYDSELLGKVIEVTHDNNIVSIYQSIEDSKVAVGDKVLKGSVIASSGTSKLNPNGENLHFEVLKNGTIQNPNTIIGKNTKEL